MSETHPAYLGLPAVHMAELSTYKGRWTLTLVGPGPEVLGGPDDLGPADRFADAHPDDPGRFLTCFDGTGPVPPLRAAAHALELRGYLVVQTSAQDPKTAEGWTQICYGAADAWSAPCHPTAP